MKSEKWIVCRVCLNQPKEVMQTIFSEEKDKDLTRMILECGGVPIKQFDHYPDKICSKCHRLLQMSYKFRLTCQRSYKHLSRFIAPVEVDQPILEELVAHTRNNEVVTRNNEVVIRNNEVVTRNIEVVTRNNEIVNRNNEIVTRDNEIVTRDNDIDIRDSQPMKIEQDMQVEDEIVDQEQEVRQIDLTELEDDSAEADTITLKLEPENDDLRNFGQVDELYYEAVYETFDGIEEVQEPEEREPSEISAEIEFLDDFEELDHAHDNTSDDDFIPNAASKAPKRKRAIVKPAPVSTVNTRQQIAKTSNTPKRVLNSRVKEQSVPPKTTTTIKLKKEPISSYICDVCGNMYHSQGRLTEHIKLHSGIKPHECEICGHRFAQTQQLARHMNTHTGNRPYKCNYCTAAFADLSTRNKHHRIHTNERPYSCDVCGKTFTYTNTLKFHKMIHTGEKPHVCDICGKGFQQANKLRIHKRVHEKRGITSSSVKVEIDMDDVTLLHNLDVATGVPLMEM